MNHKAIHPLSEYVPGGDESSRHCDSGPVGRYSASADVTIQLTKHRLRFSKPMTGVLRLKNIHSKV